MFLKNEYKKIKSEYIKMTEKSKVSISICKCKMVAKRNWIPPLQNATETKAIKLEPKMIPFKLITN